MAKLPDAPRAHGPDATHIEDQRAQGLRFAWVVTGKEAYGIRRAAYTLVDTLEAMGASIAFVAIDDLEFTQALRAEGREVHCLDMRNPPNLGGSLPSRVRSVRRMNDFVREATPALVDALRAVRCDAVHVLWPTLIGVGGAAARRVGVPCFWEMSNVVGAGRTRRFVSRIAIQHLLWKSAVMPIANSHFTAMTLGSIPVRARVMQLGIDPTRFDPDRVAPVDRAEIPAPAAAPMLGVFARLHPSKGQLVLLRAVAELGESASDLQLLVAGSSVGVDHEGALRREAGSLGLASRTHFVGQVDEVERWIAACDIVGSFCLAPEAFGLSVVEAMMMRRPVLAHALGGPSETVVDGVTGWHIGKPTVEAFAAGLSRALADRDRWGEMGAAGRARALGKFTAQAQAHRYLDIVIPEIEGAA